MHFYRHLLRHSLATLVLCSALPTFGADNAPTSPDICVEKRDLNNKLSPFDLWKSIRSCVMAENYEVAIYTYALAGSFGRFDTMRVADKTAHQAAGILPIAIMGSLPEDRKNAFQKHVQQALGNDSVRKAYCAEVESMGPPDYIPVYMIQHGMGAFSGASKEPFVVPFDPKTAWPQAVKDYLSCPQ